MCYADAVYSYELYFPVSIIPHEKKISEVLNILLVDLYKGITTGFEKIDEEDKKNRIFMDFVLRVDVTSAINAKLFVLGHNASV